MTLLSNKITRRRQISSRTSTWNLDNHHGPCSTACSSPLPAWIHPPCADDLLPLGPAPEPAPTGDRPRRLPTIASSSGFRDHMLSRLRTAFPAASPPPVFAVKTTPARYPRRAERPFASPVPLPKRALPPGMPQRSAAHPPPRRVARCTRRTWTPGRPPRPLPHPSSYSPHPWRRLRGA